MKKLLKLLLFPALCAFFILQAQQVTAQSKDNDVLVMEFGFPNDGKKETYGIYVFWPDKEMEFTALQTDLKGADVVGDRKRVAKKINELCDAGWELDLVVHTPGQVVYFSGITSYYFKRATPK